MIQFNGHTHLSEKHLLLIFCLSLLHHPLPSTSGRSPIDTDDFKDLLLHTDTYVDKSLLIEELLQDNATCKIIHRPRRWGKTVNLNMLARFFEVETYPNGTILPDELKQNRKLFTGGEFDLGGNKTKLLKPLKIASNEDVMKLQGQYPVIYLSWKGINGSNFDEVVRNMRNRVAEVYAKFKYLNCSTNLHKFDHSYLKRFLINEFYSSDVMVSMNFLSKCLFKHFGKKVMIFVDDYDIPALNAYQQYSGGDVNETRKYGEVLGFLRTVYVQTFHMNGHLENSLASGTIELSLLKEVHFYCLYDPKYSQFYGFHQQELEDLLAKVQFTTDFESIKKWYGYKYNESAIVYNPGSIMRYIARNGSFEYSWVDVNRTGIDTVLFMNDLQPQFRNLSLGLSITCLANFTDVWHNFNMIVKPSNIYVILLFSGIISPVDGKWGTSDRHEMTAANLEIQHLLRFKVKEWETQNENLTKAELLSTHCPSMRNTSEPISVGVLLNVTDSNTTTKMA